MAYTIDQGMNMGILLMATAAGHVVHEGERGMTNHAHRHAIPHVRINTVPLPRGATVLFPEEYLRGYVTWRKDRESIRGVISPISEFGITPEAHQLAATVRHAFENIFTRPTADEETMLEIFGLSEMVLKRWVNWGVAQFSAPKTYALTSLRTRLAWVPMKF